MIFVAVSFGIYFLLMLLLITGWHRAINPGPLDFQERPNQKISVVIPFRNEVENLTNVIGDLTRQSYPPDLCQVLLCNDHSTDDSVNTAADAIRNAANFQVVHSPGQGKKQALTYAIGVAAGHIVVTTDADCRLPENWLVTISAAFDNPAVEMVFGGVRVLPAASFFSALQALEFSSLVGSAAATLACGFPTLCNAANLAFRKSAFVEVDGYAGNMDIPSGDDEFLMRKISGRFPGSIRFLNSADAVVSTRPQESVGAFFAQRLRWAAKWKYNPSVSTVALAFFILIFQTEIGALLFVTPFVRTIAPVVMVLMIVKFLLEYFFLSRVGNFLRIRWSWAAFFTLQLVYPFYVLAVGVASNGMAYAWKERTARRGKATVL